MHAASRDALREAGRGLDDLIDRSRPDDLGVVADELFAVTALLDREPPLRRALGDPATEPERRQSLLDTVLGDRLGDHSLALLRPLVRSRWSDARDLVHATEELARRAGLGVAERTGALDEVEDELFRFGRILAAEPRLRRLLEDTGAPAEGRLALLDRLVGSRVNPATRRLLEQAVRAPRGRSLDRAVTELVELAATRRERYVAYVTAPAPLTAEQEQRLTATLARIYGRQVSLRVAVDPELLGGLTVRVNDEVIDGGLASRLAEARHRLAG